ncbi:MAG TPA: hypothetical protein VND19_21510 [Acetobacteraceae bacterium]|nr:hypothetical protein [Acetobacteraceae bacterium]
MLAPATPEEAHAAQILTGATMAAWLACGWIPAIRPYATKIRVAILGAYLLGCIAYVGYVMLR